MGTYCTGLPRSWPCSPSRHKGPDLTMAPASDIWWPSLEICSNLFTGPHYTGPLLPPVLTSGGYWSMYGWQVCSMHSTWMLSCFKIETFRNMYALPNHMFWHDFLVCLKLHWSLQKIMKKLCSENFTRWLMCEDAENSENLEKFKIPAI